MKKKHNMKNKISSFCFSKNHFRIDPLTTEWINQSKNQLTVSMNNIIITFNINQIFMEKCYEVCKYL